MALFWDKMQGAVSVVLAITDRCCCLGVYEGGSLQRDTSIENREQKLMSLVKERNRLRLSCTTAHHERPKIKTQEAKRER